MSSAGDLDEFRLVRPLGRGGMGEVFLGHDTVLDRAVAIKLIGSRDPDAASRERFLTEARAIARLSHPNVVTIFRVGTTTDGRPFLVQELIRGRSLDRIPRPVPWRQLCELAIGIARGLDTAHRRGILHRDIKPANVMVDEHGTPRLLDFGLAKLTATSPRAADEDTRDAPAVTDAVAETRDLPAEVSETRDAPPSRAGESTTLADGSPPSDHTHTRAGALIGTPRYCAPEVWRGEPATARSDLYSLGAMLYELATGAAPYPQRDLDELERAVLAGAAPEVAEVAPGLPTPIAREITRCLALDPRGRPGSAAEVVHELEAVLVDAPVVPGGNPYRGLRAFDAEHRALFFGRGPDISVIVDRLRTEALVVVAGDSGIGKSSVCRAGVVPAVIVGALEDRRRWRSVAVVPGKRPWDALRDALVPDAPADQPARELVRAAHPASDTGVLLVIDQLEELVTVADPAQAARVGELLAAIADGVPGVKALLAVRGDFLTRVAAIPELGAPLTRGLHLLRVLSPADLREAIVGPARACGVAFETEAMIEQLVSAVAGNVGALPLLQFTLAELWNARDAARGVIPTRALDELGGVEGALARRADAVLLELGADERATARRILLRLVTTAHTRAVRDRDELIGDGAAATLEALVRGRLVVARDTIDGSPSYELAHEALIRGWGTLRDWLDAAAGQHAVRNRLIASAAEWQRLDRKPELLWSRRQVDETRDLRELAGKEQEFLAASRALLRRRRLARIGAVVAVPAIAIAIYAAVRIDAARKRDQAIAERVTAATTSEQTARDAATRAAAARTAAFAAFDRADAAAGETRWAEARVLGDEAQRAYRDTAAELEAAHLVGGDVRAQMTAVLWASAEVAEAEHDKDRVVDLLRRLETYDATRLAEWRKPAHFVVELDRPATIAVHLRATDGATIAGGFQREPIAVQRSTKLELELAPGSYLAVISAEDGIVVRDPVMLVRGETLAHALAIPHRIPAGYVYIPRTRFLFGSPSEDEYRKNFLHTDPLHAVVLDAYWIGRTEVTFRDWIDYLHALPDDQRRVRIPKTNNGSAMELEDHAGRYTVVMKIATEIYRAAEDELLTYPDRTVRRSVTWERLPVTGVSWEDAHAYAAWLDASGRLPGARLCKVREWEHAARGADGRSYPHGESLDPSQANIDLTYKRQPLAWGPDEVGSYPASDSPFGVADLAGNVWELVVGPNGETWLKGGSWYQSSRSALSPNRDLSEPKQRDLRIGIRICADATR